MPATDSTRFLSLATPLGEDALLPKALSGTEEVGRMFRYDLTLVGQPGVPIDFDKILGQNLTVRLHLHDDTPRYFNGYVSRFALARADARYFEYHAVVVPWLWFLTRIVDCRIFQDKTGPEIIKEVFKGRGYADFDDRLKGTYQKWEYCVQYRETDFNFVSRIMEQEGIYYYFEHVDKKHTLVLCDSQTVHSPAPDTASLPWKARTHRIDNLPCVWDLTSEQELQPGKCTLSDFDYKAPRRSMRFSAAPPQPRKHTRNAFEVYDYATEYDLPDDGKNYAKLRIEEMQARFETVSAQSDCRALAAGRTLSLTDYPQDDRNQEYLLTSVNHRIRSDAFDAAGDGGGGGRGPTYSCTFSAISRRDQFRSARVTPKPVVQGIQTAIVVGPSGQELYVNEFGRVKVQFHWDRLGKADEHSSCWIRVAQSWAGKRWGASFWPRIGHEVVVAFLEGDPDQPLIVGSVYNGEAKPPYIGDGPDGEHKDDPKVTGFKSNSTPGGDGFNEIRFDDTAGSEQLFLHAEHDQDTRVKHDARTWVGNDQHLVVKHDQLDQVGHDRNETVSNDHMETIGRDRHLNVTGKQAVAVGQSHSFTVSGDVIEVFKGSHSEQTSMNYYVKAMGVVIEATTSITLKCGANSIVIDPTGVTLTGAMVTIDGQMVMIASGPGSPAMSGQAGNAVPPAAPANAKDADDAKPGQVTTTQSSPDQPGAGPGGASFMPYSATSSSAATKRKTWIEVVLVDQDKKPVPGAKYRVTTPDGTVHEGTLDDKGLARVEGLDPGTCKITFPELDKDAWKAG